MAKYTNCDEEAKVQEAVEVHSVPMIEEMKGARVIGEEQGQPQAQKQFSFVSSLYSLSFRTE